jgi:MoxR-like ATPase
MEKTHPRGNSQPSYSLTLYRSLHLRFHFISTSPDQSLDKGQPMKPAELFEALHALITERVPLHIWGACSVGKSQVVAQVASDLGWQFLDIRAVQLDQVDLCGLPRISADQAEWAPPKFLLDRNSGARQPANQLSYRLDLG